LVIAVLDPDDTRLTAFLDKRFHESFLLNILRADALRIADLAPNGRLKALASVAHGSIRIQTGDTPDRALFIDAIAIATTARQPVNHVVCPAEWAGNASQALADAGIESDIDDTATFFRRDLDSVTAPFPEEGVLCRKAGKSDATALAECLLAPLAPTAENIAYANQLAMQRCSGDEDFWVLERGGTPLSFGGISECAATTVKIAGVLTPPTRRGEGNAPRLINSFLAAIRDDGFQTAALLARNDTARRCYDRMGFERIGTFTTLDLRNPR
jgi:N-acetylglutamate synthase-like GNAT family acetyltransferase